MIQGMGGFMSITGEKDGEPGAGPQKAGIPIIDIMTGMYASIAVCAALTHRAETGIGQHLDLALLDTQVAILANQGANFLATGVAPGRLGNAHPNIVPYQPFKTSDGDVIVACGNDNLFGKLCEVMNRSDLPKDARFASNAKRVENRNVLVPILQAEFMRRNTQDWVEALEAAGVANGPINNLAQVFEEPQVKARELRMELDAPYGKVSSIRSPMRFSETPLEFKNPAPVLGQHSDDVLKGLLKMSEADIAKLREGGII